MLVKILHILWLEIILVFFHHNITNFLCFYIDLNRCFQVSGISNEKLSWIKFKLRNISGDSSFFYILHFKQRMKNALNSMFYIRNIICKLIAF